MNGKKRKSTKKKKFFILIACYLAIFVITSALTLATLSWFSGSTWSSNTVYMGGPVYIKFTDNAENETSGTNKLVLNLPEGWDRLYPGMNIQIEAKAVIQGAKFENKKDNGDELIVYTTGAILRAKVMLTVTDPMGYSNLNPHPSTEEGYSDKNDIIADVTNGYGHNYKSQQIQTREKTKALGFTIKTVLKTKNFSILRKTHNRQVTHKPEVLSFKI